MPRKKLKNKLPKPPPPKKVRIGVMPDFMKKATLKQKLTGKIKIPSY